MMNFVKQNQDSTTRRTVLNDWTWGNPNYEFSIPLPKTNVMKITIDISNLMADVKKENNIFENK
jgi:hypothetical protein